MWQPHVANNNNGNQHFQQEPREITEGTFWTIAITVITVAVAVWQWHGSNACMHVHAYRRYRYLHRCMLLQYVTDTP